MKKEWDLSPLEGNFRKKRKEWEKATERFVSKWRNRQDYLQNPSSLKEALDEYENWARNYGTSADEYFYFWLKTQDNQIDPKLKAKFLGIEGFSKKIENEISFFALNISRIPKEKQKEFLDFEGLKDYRHFLEKLFEEAKYLLSEKEEKIMNMKSTSSYSSWVKMVAGFLSKEERMVIDENDKEVKRNFSEILSLIDNSSKKIRDSAAVAFNDILLKNSDVAESEINALLGDKKVNDELRGFERPDKARHVADDIDSEIVDSLVRAVSKKFKISRKYYELKAKLLGVKKLEYHERQVSYSSLNKKYNYDDSYNLVYNVFSNLDEKFARIFKDFNEKGQIDVFLKKGKRQGAYCAYSLKSRPTFVMLNHTDKIRDVTSIAHEMGHAINNEFIKESQNALNFGTPLSTAEVASTFMEDFVAEELMKSADDELKLGLMVEKLNDNVSSIFRQVAGYMFEQELHKKFRESGYLSKNEIGELFLKHMHDYMGKFVELSKGSENWWVYWWHIREYFYVYSYASGLLISKALQKIVRSDKSNIEKVKQFLSTGLSKSPKEIFAGIGIDITKKEFWKEGLKEVEDLLNETEKLARKLGKI